MALVEQQRGYPGDRDGIDGDTTILPIGHPFRIMQEQMEDVERANGGLNPNALLPRLKEWCRSRFRGITGR